MKNGDIAYLNSSVRVEMPGGLVVGQPNEPMMTIKSVSKEGKITCYYFNAAKELVIVVLPVECLTVWSAEKPITPAS